MKFGLFGGATAGRNTSTDDSDSFHKFTDFIVEADNVGLHGLFVVEHHFTGFGQVSSTMNLLTYLAARPRRIRLGTRRDGAALAQPGPARGAGGDARRPVQRPARHGRRQGLPLQRIPAFLRRSRRGAIDLRRVDRADEAAPGPSEERFSYHSPRWNFENIVVEPAPVQKPHPPLWLAAGKPESSRRPRAADTICCSTSSPPST